MAIGRVNTGGGGTGATLVITGVAGDTCTITKDGKAKTKTFDSTGTATFKGLATGTWTVTMTNSSGSTATRTVTVNADYTLAITYFIATIAVTYPEGSTCTCSDGNTTLTAPDTSGSYTFTVGNIATWTVTCTNGEDTASQDVSITAEGQSKSVTLAYGHFLYLKGNTFDTETGGWEATAAYSQGNHNSVTPSLTFDEDNFFAEVSGASNTGVVKTANKIDLSSVSTVKVNVAAANSSSENCYGHIVALNTTSSNWALSSALKKFIDSGTATLDVSKVDSAYVGIALSVGAEGGLFSVRVSEIELI